MAATTDEMRQIAEAFEVFDRDGSGKISYSELKDILCSGESPMCSAEELEETLTEFDVDEDGVLGLEEFTKVSLMFTEAVISSNRV